MGHTPEATAREIVLAEFGEPLGYHALRLIDRIAAALREREQVAAETVAETSEAQP